MVIVAKATNAFSYVMFLSNGDGHFITSIPVPVKWRFGNRMLKRLKNKLSMQRKQSKQD